MAGSTLPPSEASRPRGRLFRKYVVVIVALVAGLLVASGAVELWFSYQENKAALVALQREKAVAAATRIESFVREIEREMGWTTQPVLAAGPAALEQRRIDFLRLLRQVPPITELSHVDSEGIEQLQVSRLAMDVMGQGRDLSGDPRFTTARAAKVYHGPVYFRKESEPYMALALAQSGGGVTVAEVNLKFIWDVVSQIAIGKAGRAFVVDGAGNLIAHPDISLVLQKTNLSRLAHVATALGAAPPGVETTVAHDVAGRSVLTAHATIPGLKWAVVVEQPSEEAFAPLRASAQRTVVVAILGVGLAVFASLLLARRMVQPIQALQVGAARIGAGELGHRIDVRTNDELQALAGEFNRMTATLQESYATLEQRVVDRTAELTETLEQQTATGEILGVISSSPTDVQPVFEAIVASCKRLLEARSAVVLRVVGHELRLAAFTRTTPEADAELERFYPLPLGGNSAASFVVRERIPFVSGDAQADDRIAPAAREVARRRGYHSMVIVPMLRKGEAIGTINVSHPEARAFSDKDIALLQTFADQAVIAIENVRLFSELQQRNAEVTEALEQQTATGNILSVISSSPTDTQPVFDAIAESATRLLRGWSTVVLRLENELLQLSAAYGGLPGSAEAIRGQFPWPVSRGSFVGDAILDRTVTIIEDIERWEGPPELREIARARGWRANVVVPMLREGSPIGVIAVSRVEPGPFAPREIELLQVFADQAVIAVENVRLFTELERRNAEVTEALEQQTATGEILRVISSSPTDVQPVFNAIVANAVRLCNGFSAIAFRFDGQALVPVAKHGFDERAWALIGDARPPRPTTETMSGRAFVERRIVHMADILAEPVSERSRRLAEEIGYRAFLAVPMMREGQPIGVINITRREPEAFSPKQIDVMTTFADQAVIAVENVRLFSELQQRNVEVTESLEQQTATSEILRTISGAQTHVQPVFDVIAENVRRLFRGVQSGVFTIVGDAIHLAAYAGSAERLEQWARVWPRPLSEAPMYALAVHSGDVVHMSDLEHDPRLSETGRALAAAMGQRSGLIAPMLREGVVIGLIGVARAEAGAFSDKQISMLRTFADQAVIAIENVRLFTELQERTTQLQVASRHKDEFLANMSHELRTPLNAIIGFSEVMLERMFGDINEKQEEYLTDILSSGRHLLSLINDILDLSKIEAGRMELDLADFNLAVAIDNAHTLVHERAARRGLVLSQDVDGHIGEFRGDERKIKQVLLNLLSNAVKFTPEGGRVTTRAVLKGDVVEISVADTGVGIAPGDQETVFEEFRQVGTDLARKHEGTGLGLALARRFVELHGGNIWLESEVGVGSTFTFALPVRR